MEFNKLPEYIREQWELSTKLPDGRRWWVWIGSNGNPFERTMCLDDFIEQATEQAQQNAKGLFRACEVTQLVSRHKGMDASETKNFMCGLQMAVKLGELPFVRCDSGFAYRPNENERFHAMHYLRREDLDAWLSRIGYGYTLPLPETQPGNPPTQPAATAPPKDAALPSPAPVAVVKPKAKRCTWRDVSSAYIVEVMQAGQYATAKELYRALEAKAGPDTPFDKGEKANHGSLFVREIAQSLSLKTVQNEWAKLLELANK